jgi:GNAT superfamily N-acetyltransferase
MNTIIDKANQFKYSSLEYVDSDEVRDPIVCINNDESIFFYCMEEGKAKVYWAVNLKEIFFRGLEKTIDIIARDDSIRNVVIEFIPEDYLPDMEEYGFTIISEWVDYWIKSLDDVNLEQSDSLIIRRIEEDEYQLVSDITISCRNYSRGYMGETPEWMREWNESENSCIFIAELNSEIVGLCCVSLYGFDNEKGIVLWLREIAVKPNYHSQRIGLNLMAYAINWGKSQGAVRSFLACDAQNDKAIKLYERIGYVRMTGRGQINMGRTL